MSRAGFTRRLTTVLKRAASQFPAVTLTGPRQSGKTTLVKKAFPEKPYVNLEDPDTNTFAIEDPRGFLKQFPDGAILDEFQKVPEIPSYLQGILDERQIPGMFILTGSQQLEVSRRVSQSLAGRTAVLKLLPLSLGEAYGGRPPDLDEVLLRGGFPRLHRDRPDPGLFFGGYLETYLERDLRELTQVHDLSLFKKCLRLLAGRAGQILNANSLAGDIGVSQPTIRHWISILEAGYIVCLLEPFHRNLVKRLTKSPKIFFYDTGLLCHLLGIKNRKELATHPLRGSIFENWVFTECLKAYWHRGSRMQVSFYRDLAGHEVDFILEEGAVPLPIEVKAAATVHTDFAKPLLHFHQVAGSGEAPGWVVYGGENRQTRGSIQFLPWGQFPKELDSFLSLAEDEAADTEKGFS